MLDHIPGRFAKWQGQRLRYFGGTSYLGLATSSNFAELIKAGIDRYGSNYGGSRLSSPRIRIFEEAEAWIAQWAGLPAALTVSSGSLAGQLLMKYCATVGECHYAPGTHPALLGPGQAYTEDFDAWSQKVPAILEKAARPVFIMASTVDAIHSRRYSFEWLHSLPANRPFTLILDDAHGVGVYGDEGKGFLPEVPRLPQIELVLTASLAKAMGVPGGFVAGSEALIQRLWQQAFFGGASPILPPYLYALLQGQDLYQEARRHLAQLQGLLRSKIAETGLFQSFPGYPVWYTAHEGMASFLLQYGILIPQFHYPTPSSPMATRMVVSAHHELEDIERLQTGIHAFAKQLDL